MHSIFVVTTCQPVLIFRNVVIVKVNFSSYLCIYLVCVCCTILSHVLFLKYIVLYNAFI